MQIKKILGILLAFCFLMSVTAAAVSAAPDNMRTDKDKLKIIDPREDKKKDDDKKRDDNKKRDDDKKRDNDRDRMKRGHFEKGHFEWKLVKEYKKIRGHIVVIKVWKRVFIPGHWVFNYR